MPDEVEVAYTVKELIKGLSDRIDGFMQMMGQKADQSTVAQVMLRQDQHEVRISKLEQENQFTKRHSTAKQEFKRWIVPTAAAVAAAVVALFQVWHP